jgi:hypothetical protein
MRKEGTVGRTNDESQGEGPTNLQTQEHNTSRLEKPHKIVEAVERKSPTVSAF